MLRRRLFVIGIISLAAALTAAVADNANLRKFYLSRGARIDCTDDPGGANGSPLCQRANVIVDRGIVENVEKSKNVTVEDQIDEDDEKTLTGQTPDDTEEENDETAIDEARGKKDKKRGYLKVFFMMAAAAKATLLYAMIHAVALVAGKALVVAKVALALAAAVALKKALEHHDKTSVEIVKHPHHTYSQTHSASIDYDHHGGYEGGHRRRRRHAR
ncbi:uncharacterized protein [Venturia canescens]|uniref:uncharacterized protein n=1 Tax=Venturia canescens TaxID=32260 RepID=UPI001C9BD9FF|nr:uncharacterized protein LOC122406606 [Venturia canescens]